MALTPVASIPSPQVHVLEKKRNGNVIVCRPICSFCLEVKIVLSLYNKALTYLLDSFFLLCSYAFRKPHIETHTFMHLQAVKNIQAYRLNHLNEPLYVAECDMQKFYDTIDYRVIKARFNKLFAKIKTQESLSHLDCQCIKRWFYSYVDCFDFATHVEVYNSKLFNSIWNSIKDRDNKICTINWVDELRSYIKTHKKEKKSLECPKMALYQAL